MRSVERFASAVHLTGAQPVPQRGDHLISTRNQNSFINSLFVILAPLIAVIPFAAAQTPPASNPVADVIAANVSMSPTHRDSSSAVRAAPQDPDNAAFDPARKPDFEHSPHLRLTVYQGQIADPMTVYDKIVGGLKNSVSLFSMTGWLASAGYEQLTNGSPNYGADAGAFGQRLGIGAIHGITDGVFSNSLFAPIFHEDPRYYVMGPGHPFLKRLVYAASRSIISRTDSGHSVPNLLSLPETPLALPSP